MKTKLFLSIALSLLIDCQSGEVIARGELNEIDAMLGELLQ